MPQGLPRKLRYAFIVQAVMMSVAIAIGILVTGSIVKNVLAVQRLRAEADSYWHHRAGNPGFALPATTTVRGYFLAPGQSATRLPPEMRTLQPGITDQGSHKVLSDERPEGHLYLSMSFELLDTAIDWMRMVSIVLALLAVSAATWLTYRTSRRLVAPVGWLAEEVARWDPGDANADTIVPEHVPEGSGREVQQLGGALQEMSTRVHDFVRRERDFTREASHELRTPLTVVRVATDMMLADPDTSQRAQRSLLRMQRAGRDMEAVIDAFLILAREDGDAALTEDFEVADIVEDEADKARVRLQDKQVELVVNLHARPRLHASPRVLAVILDNLLENACAFTDQGRVEVILEADRVIVHDTGIGMTSDILQKAYDPFYRAEQFGRGGKGMGLSIVRRLGERFGWPITLESAPGVGTTATVGFARHLLEVHR